MGLDEFRVWISKEDAMRVSEMNWIQ